MAEGEMRRCLNASLYDEHGACFERGSMVTTRDRLAGPARGACVGTKGVKGGKVVDGNDNGWAGRRAHVGTHINACSAILSTHGTLGYIVHRAFA
jgi:hypothetical protein